MLPGEKIGYSVQITYELICRFADLTNDRHPIHVDKEFGAKSKFGKNIAHGMLTGSMLSRIFGGLLNIPNAVYIKQILEFVSPVYCDDIVDVSATLKEINGRIATFETNCSVGDRVVLRGLAEILLPRPEAPSDSK